jgi:hypothetical protein
MKMTSKYSGADRQAFLEHIKKAYFKEDGEVDWDRLMKNARRLTRQEFEEELRQMREANRRRREGQGEQELGA